LRTKKVAVNKLDYLYTLDGLIKVLEDVSAWHNLDNGHGERTAITALKIGTRLNGGERLDENDLLLLDYAARIHDLGRIGIDDDLMTKAGNLTTAERGAMETHPVIGYNFLSRSSLPPQITLTILYHHEHFDGSGYPKGLKGLDIPLFARIVTIADMWDALTSDRPYRKAMAHDAALNTMAVNKAWFDGRLYYIFLEVMQEKGGK
jgi:HD-GYP domain-containing protein (c-di-GMP phosphodiesterase class II)